MDDYSRLFKASKRRENGRMIRDIKRLLASKIKLPPRILVMMIGVIVFGVDTAKLVRK